ncbi:Cytochrome P450 3A9 [Cercospora beticola]|uniref:Cytochrome P450 3A9 n=1 Tax=Cercospora beticola TaxID=122368 RepID=A0A2G5HUL6_CERBT|nr:Cytochrome P450 3A9 [Cercospora beticola]PIA95983.1 Cytochrome P450 3A9 [Cercospora beticola]WPB06768.1 hypothetical protein RHO25_011428 [Cercospora beticola]
MASTLPLPVLLAFASVAESATLVTMFPRFLPETSIYYLFSRLLGLQLLCLAIYKLFIYPFYVSPLRHVPGPKGGLPLLGHAMAEFEHPAGATFLDWMKQIPNDGLIRYRGPLHENTLFVAGPNALQEVLVTRAYEFEKPPKIRDALRPSLGNGLLFLEEDSHKFVRKNLMPLFGFRQIKALYSLFWEKSTKLTQALSQHVAESAELDGKTSVVDISQWSTKVTLDIIGLAAMGRDFRTLENHDDPLVRAYEELLEPTLERKLLFAAQVFGPGDLVRSLPIPAAVRNKSIRKNLRDTCYQLVYDKRQVIVTEPEDQKDILALCIRSNNFSDEQIVDQLLTFLAAGHETTATVLSWTSYLLARHPDVQTALRQEIRALIASSTQTMSDSELSTALEAAPLLNGVCNESLRLYPTIPLMSRSNPKPMTLLGHEIPAGTRFTICPAAVNRSPEFWGNNAEQFVPERWIDTTENGIKRPNYSGGASSNYAFLTFNHGPRSCIGQGFARAELRCLLAALVGSFEMMMVHPGEEVEQEEIVSLKPKGGVHLRLKALRDW